MPELADEQAFDRTIGWIVCSSIAVIGVVLLLVVPDPREKLIAAAALIPGFFLTFALFSAAKMRTTVDATGINIALLMFIRRRIAFAEIKTADAVQYDPLRDYGGWGLRMGPKGKAYNMRGDRGVQLVLENGSRVLIGSQREQELEAAVRAGLR